MQRGDKRKVREGHQSNSRHILTEIPEIEMKRPEIPINTNNVVEVCGS